MLVAESEPGDQWWRSRSNSSRTTPPRWWWVELERHGHHGEVEDRMECFYDEMNEFWLCSVKVKDSSHDAYVGENVRIFPSQQLQVLTADFGHGLFSVFWSFRISSWKFHKQISFFCSAVAAATIIILPPSTMKIAMPINITTAPVLIIGILLSIVCGCDSSDEGEWFLSNNWNSSIASNGCCQCKPSIIRHSTVILHDLLHMNIAHCWPHLSTTHSFDFSREICHLWIGRETHSCWIGWKLLSP